eukprot:1839807-Amphidinium_carterae.1
MESEVDSLLACPVRHTEAPPPPDLGAMSFKTSCCEVDLHAVPRLTSLPCLRDAMVEDFITGNQAHNV